MFEIIVFENQDIYHLETIPDSKDPVLTYLELCKTYVNPEYVDESNTGFSYGNMWVSYSDRSGNDKPMIVFLIGDITPIIAQIKEGLKNIYVKG